MENNHKSSEEILAEEHIDKACQSAKNLYECWKESDVHEAFLAGYKAASQAKDEVIRELVEAAETVSKKKTI